MDENFKIPLWVYAAMEQLDLSDSERGKLTRWLYEYYVKNEMPEDIQYEYLSPAKSVFYCVVAAIGE